MTERRNIHPERGPSNEGDRNNQSGDGPRRSLDTTRRYTERQQALTTEHRRITQHHDNVSYTDYEGIARRLGQSAAQIDDYINDEVEARDSRRISTIRIAHQGAIDEYNRLVDEFKEHYLSYANEIQAYNLQARDHNQYCPPAVRANEIQDHLSIMNVAYSQEAEIQGLTPFMDNDWELSKFEPLSPLRPNDGSSSDET